MTFREGRADDYITFTTGYDYKKYNIDDEKIKLINNFFDSIFRIFFQNLLAIPFLFPSLA